MTTLLPLTFTQWVTSTSLPHQLVDALARHNYSTIRDVRQMDEEDIEDIVNDLDLRKQLKAATIWLRTHYPDPTNEPGPYINVPKAVPLDRLETVPGRSLGGGLTERCIVLREVSRCEKLRIRRVQAGNPDPNAPQRILLFLGETGSGKSTMIDAVANHHLGVTHEDKYRLRLVDPSLDNSSGKKSDSQTDWVTTYTLPSPPGAAHPATLLLVDTPGFGDTRGLARDQLIVTQIRELFGSQGELSLGWVSAVCVVVRASLTRLTASQQYVFQTLQSMFGRDVLACTAILISFWTGDNKRVLQALEDAGVRHSAAYSFNNQGVRGQVGPMGAPMWEAGGKEVGRLLEEVGAGAGVSMKLTVQVLEKRRILEALADGMLRLTQSTSGQLAALAARKRAAREKPAPGKQTICIKTLVTERYHTRNKSNFSCLKCQTTCISDLGALTRVGYALTPGTFRNCEVCGCLFKKHKTGTWQYRVSEREVNKPVPVSNAHSADAVHAELAGIAAEEDALFKRLQAQCDRMYECQRDLDDIALRPRLQSQTDHFERVIAQEEVQRSPGWKERVEMLREVRRRAEMVAIVGLKGERPNIKEVLCGQQGEEQLPGGKGEQGERQGRAEGDDGGQGKGYGRAQGDQGKRNEHAHGAQGDQGNGPVRAQGGQRDHEKRQENEYTGSHGDHKQDNVPVYDDFNKLRPAQVDESTHQMASDPSREVNIIHHRNAAPTNRRAPPSGNPKQNTHRSENNERAIHQRAGPSLASRDQAPPVPPPRPAWHNSR